LLQDRRCRYWRVSGKTLVRGWVGVVWLLAATVLAMGSTKSIVCGRPRTSMGMSNRFNLDKPDNERVCFPIFLQLRSSRSRTSSVAGPFHLVSSVMVSASNLCRMTWREGPWNGITGVSSGLIPGRVFGAILTGRGGALESKRLATGSYKFRGTMSVYAQNRDGEGGRRFRVRCYLGSKLY
jgi:hypothetical protein